MRTFKLFSLMGVQTTISPVGLASFGIAVFVLAGAAAALSGLALGEALLAGLLGAAVMAVFEWVHQMGHALAARRTGYPMRGLHFHSILAVSEYPPDEPDLPARVHIQRALGGFWINLLIGLFLTPYAFFLSFVGGVTAWVVGFAAFYNFVVLGLGALVPIDLPGVLTTDGATLRRYWGKDEGRQSRDGGG